MLDKQEINEFNVDDYRTELVLLDKIDELRKSYDGNLPSLKETDSSLKWNKHAMTNNTLENPITTNRILKIADMTFKYKKKNGITSILDFGFGYAGIVDKIKSDKSIKYKGIDISDKFIEIQSRKYQDYSNILFKKENLFEMNEIFDIIYALEVLEHIEPNNLFSILNKLYDLLSFEGFFIVSVPLYDRLAEITNYCSNCGHLENSNGHVRSYTPKLILKELEMANFKVLEVKEINYGIDILSKIKFIIKKIIGKEIKPKNLVIVAKKKK